MRAPPERLGSFFLGAEYDLHAKQRSDTPVNYDARDLTTHAVCVGMTGSGKTGLCIGLLEEAALDRVPAIIIDPKGDITNLLLQFPDLRPDDFLPWINEDDARRSGQSAQQYAQTTADQWRNGLADWGIAPERIRALKESVDYTIFTPGSDAGVPVSIVGSLAAPDVDFDANAEMVRERISGTVAALLGLADLRVDPVRSREAILLANIFEYYWRQNQDLDLTKLILACQKPPVSRLGVFDVDTFYPEKDRFELAMAFNNLIAAPSFQTWLQGEPLDVDHLFFTREGKPRHSIFYIAHLNDNERMFFVTLLLENILAWARRQSGTTSLRALLYFDEIFGYFPPVAEPPSKRPMLTLLKQARAFGLGCVLVTQNPMDLDYKGLSNAGTWFIGKLQAERDKDRVLEGLKGAIAESGGNTEPDFDALISLLESRIFLLHNVHSDAPIVFQTRWAMSYLRGPLTRPQVHQLMAGRLPAPGSDTIAPMPTASPALRTASAQPTASPSVAPPGFHPDPPSLDPGVAQVYLPVVVNDAAAVHQLTAESNVSLEPQQVQMVYEPAIVGVATLHYLERKWQIDHQSETVLLAPLPDGLTGVDWAGAEALALSARDFRRAPEQVDAQHGPFFASLPEGANGARALSKMARDLADWLYDNSRLKVNIYPSLDLCQGPDEPERDFRIRLQQAAREARDAEVDKLEDEYEPKFARLRAKSDKERRELAADQAEQSARQQSEYIGVGETLLGFFFGRRSTRSLSAAASRRRMTLQAQMEVEESHQELAEVDEQIAALDAEFKERTGEITVRYANLLDELTTEEIAPRRNDVDVQLTALAWLPSWLIHYNDGFDERTATVAAYQLPS